MTRATAAVLVCVTDLRRAPAPATTRRCGATTRSTRPAPVTCSSRRLAAARSSCARRRPARRRLRPVDGRGGRVASVLEGRARSGVPHRAAVRARMAEAGRWLGGAAGRTTESAHRRAAVRRAQRRSRARRLRTRRLTGRTRWAGDGPSESSRRSPPAAAFAVVASTGGASRLRHGPRSSCRQLPPRAGSPPSGPSRTSPGRSSSAADRRTRRGRRRRTRRR